MKSLREMAHRIFEEAMDACSVSRAFASKVSAKDNILRLGGVECADLSEVKRILIIAIGKGAGSLLQAFLEQRSIVDGREVLGVLDAPDGLENLPAGISYFRGGHPLPNEASFAAARKALDLLVSSVEDSRASETFCFFLMSGGGSAMFELPLDPSISLEDTAQFHQALVHSGASITEVNCIRKHFSAAKGGRLASAARELRHITLAVSDVPSGQSDSLSSGPTVPDSSTVEQCRAVLEKYALLRQFPESVQRFFMSPQFVETPKVGEIRGNIFPVLSSDDLAVAASEAAERCGFKTFIDNSCDDWDYAAAADYLLDRLRVLRREHGRVCLISSGEVTVRMPCSNHEKRAAGGRNQHFALYSALQLQKLESTVILSVGSDGIDGNSMAAGAVVDITTVLERRFEAQRALSVFDSFSFLNAIGDTVITGPTGNNLRDLRVLLTDE